MFLIVCNKDKDCVESLYDIIIYFIYDCYRESYELFFERIIVIL